ncbi:MAG: hypothetical protein AAF570_12795 [Bacteroidota bacterium]
MKYFLWICFAMLLWSGCESGDGQQSGKDSNTVEAQDENAIKKGHLEVMEVHDTAMLKMELIYNQISELKKIEERLKKEGEDANKSALEKVNSAINKLQAADDAMMDLMHNYRMPDESTPEKESLRYLDEQKVIITEVDQKMDESIDHASTLRKEFDTP